MNSVEQHERAGRLSGDFEALWQRLPEELPGLCYIGSNPADVRAMLHEACEHVYRAALAEQSADLAATRAEVEGLRTALQEIHEQYGLVCNEFETCTHRACMSSYASWAIADAALRPAEPSEGPTT